MSQGAAESAPSHALNMALGLLQSHDWPTRLRLWSGLTLFAFVTTHLTHHALGLVSLGTMERALEFFLRIWTTRTGEAVLGTALAVHLTLVSAKMVSRTTLRMPAVEWVRLVLGLLTLTLLSVHLASNIYLYEVLELPHGYAPYLLKIWPWAWPLQFVLMVSAWSHGCIGIHLWLRLRPGYRRLQPVWLGLAVLVPALALTGLLSAAEVSHARALDPKWVKDNLEDFAYTADVGSRLMRMNLILVAGIACLIAGAQGLRQLLILRNRRRGVRIRYPGRDVLVPRGSTVLEASRMHGIPHASICGGRGRCSTCRVRVSGGGAWLAPAGEDELKVLARIGAPENVRLACQVRCEGDLEVVPLVPPTVGPDAARPQGRFMFGTEIDIAILFSDIRGFTRLSEHTLPYDVVHLLNQYFETMSEAIESHQGHVDKFIGDGLMALFGLRQGPAAGCRSALAAAREMATRLVELNERLAHTLPEPLQIGIGIHAGSAIVGEMGHKTAAAVTAVGDAVNTASRVEGLTKKTGTQLVVTARVAELAGVDLTAFKRFRAAVKGKAEPLHIYAVPSALDLPEWLTRPPKRLSFERQPAAGPAGG